MLSKDNLAYIEALRTAVNMSTGQSGLVGSDSFEPHAASRIQSRSIDGALPSLPAPSLPLWLPPLSDKLALRRLFSRCRANSVNQCTMRPALALQGGEEGVACGGRVCACVCGDGEKAR